MGSGTRGQRSISVSWNHNSGPSITAFFPCYNDSGTIASIVITADRTLRELADDYEIIVGNDASTDNSAEILEELRALYPRLRVLHHTTNRGYGGNLRSIRPIRRSSR